MTKLFPILTVLFCLTAGQADAQRCLPGMKALEVRADMADGFYRGKGGNKAGYAFGAALSTYAKGGSKWTFGADYLQVHHPYKATHLPIAQVTAEGGYYRLFLSDDRKNVFFYIGCSALGGYETVNWDRKLLSDGATILDRDAFVYGGALTLQAEVYLSDRIALTASLRERSLWGGHTGHFHTQYGVGLKIMLD